MWALGLEVSDQLILNVGQVYMRWGMAKLTYGIARQFHDFSTLRLWSVVSAKRFLEGGKAARFFPLNLTDSSWGNKVLENGKRDSILYESGGKVASLLTLDKYEGIFLLAKQIASRKQLLKESPDGREGSSGSESVRFSMNIRVSSLNRIIPFATGSVFLKARRAWALDSEQVARSETSFVAAMFLCAFRITRVESGILHSSKLTSMPFVPTVKCTIMPLTGSALSTWSRRRGCALHLDLYRWARRGPRSLFLIPVGVRRTWGSSKSR